MHKECLKQLQRGKNNTFKLYTEAAQGLSSAQKTEQWKNTGWTVAEVSVPWAGVGLRCPLLAGAVALSLLVPCGALLSPVNPPCLPAASMERHPAACTLHFKPGSIAAGGFLGVFLPLQQLAALSRVRQYSCFNPD